ncbi:hypothetical protein EBZ80_11295 [bacterium]|nr:hypothetical protein [bacterium]
MFVGGCGKDKEFQGDEIIDEISNDSLESGDSEGLALAATVPSKICVETTRVTNPSSRTFQCGIGDPTVERSDLETNLKKEVSKSPTWKEDFDAKLDDTQNWIVNSLPTGPEKRTLSLPEPVTNPVTTPQSPLTLELSLTDNKPVVIGKKGESFTDYSRGDWSQRSTETVRTTNSRTKKVTFKESYVGFSTRKTFKATGDLAMVTGTSSLRVSLFKQPQFSLRLYMSVEPDPIRGEPLCGTIDLEVFEKTSPKPTLVHTARVQRLCSKPVELFYAHPHFKQLPKKLKESHFLVKLKKNSEYEVRARVGCELGERATALTHFQCEIYSPVTLDIAFANDNTNNNTTVQSTAAVQDNQIIYLEPIIPTLPKSGGFVFH